ncbi:MAG TPA: heme lyase CcmF/NrfE family subunit [Candidatus Saccharimonadia bacterium]|nr:heme lyase CcmF/NrfE family subunit [Candidatus Saccharimonadia bacterium]
MIPELGQFALVLALLLALVQAVLPIWGAHTRNARLIALARPAAAGQFVFVALAFGFLTWAFVVQDFSVAYVAQNSNSKLPAYYRFSAVWGAHEGSLLLWALILSIWTIAVAAFSRALPDAFVARVLGVLGVVSVGFLAFTLFTSNPFLRHLPALAEGNDLNPLLQDPGLIIHPPMLYMGYVGFSVAFAFAIAALLEGRVDTRWVRWSRPWTKVAWAFLTLGIALGSWWAYYELGWGGWWFWDPVENASFMPWLVGTALIHSQAITDKRGSFRSWTLLLAIFAFSLSLLGTFLVRSGVLTSVHAFASDPTRGLFILIFLALVTGGALLLFAVRAPRLSGENDAPFALVSRESLLMVNNLLLGSAAAMVLLGTLYPLIVDAFGWGKISVGPPYFGTLFVLLMAPLALLVPFGPFSRWQRDSVHAWGWALRGALVVASLAAFGLALASDLPRKAIAGIYVGLWIIGGTISYVIGLARDPVRRRALGYGEITGMCLAHFGIGVFVIGVMMTEATSIERDLRMGRGESTEVSGYTFRFDGTERYEGPNFIADRGTIVVTRDGDEVARLHPQKRLYAAGGQVMTEAALDPGFTRDLYVALGEPLDEGKAWAVRIYVKPYIRFIWLGALMMMLGGFIAAADRRYRVVAPAGDEFPARAAAA